MTTETLQTYLAAAKAAKSAAKVWPEMSVRLRTHCLADAVVALAAEVERLRHERELLAVQRDLARAAVKASCKVIKPKGDA